MIAQRPAKKRADYGVFLPCYRLSVADNSGFLWNSLGPENGDRPARETARRQAKRTD
jgi:hypothetical protein